LRFDKKKLDHLWILALFPIYFGLDGLYKTNDITKTGFIMPLSFFIGIVIAILFVNKVMIYGRLRIPKVIQRIPIYFFFALIISICGVGLSGDIVPIVLYAQFLSGVFGIILAIWFFCYKKMDFEWITGFVSKLYFVLIVLNIFRAVTTTGFAHFTSRFTEVPGTPWWSIYHAFVYYPYIVSMVFLYAIPYWKQRVKTWVFFLLYSGVFVYLWLFQVRGAVLTFGVGLLLYMFFYVKIKKLIGTIISIVMLVSVLVLYLPYDMVVGRFTNNSESLIKSVGGRDYLYVSFFNNITSDRLYILAGSLFKGRQIGETSAISTDFNKGSIGGSYHNQYLEFIEYGGIFLLVGFFWCIYPIIKKLIQYTRDSTNSQYKNVSYWMIIMLVQLVIDMNINVPLRVTNPAIMYWFYWSGLGIYVSYLCYKNNKKNDIPSLSKK
jgi:hypothetical protein